MAGLSLSFSYESAPGAKGRLPSARSASERVGFDAHRPTLVLFAHPHCPCTRATLDELERLLARAGDKVEAVVYFYSNEGVGGMQRRSALRERAHAMPGVVVRDDPDGRIAADMGALTSGQVHLWSPGGELLFEGGITVSRGHAGDNVGVAALAAILDGREPAVRSTLVHGCRIHDEGPDES